MKRLSILIAVCLTFAACGGGGGSSPVPAANSTANGTANGTTNSPTATSTTPPSTGFAPTSLPLNVSAYTPTVSVDRNDAHVTNLAIPQGGALAPPAQASKVHIFPVQSGTTPSVNSRRPATFINNPFDMSYFGGTVVGGAVSHNIYVSTNYRNCASTCWGTPAQFLTDLGASTFISHLDQYIGLNTTNRYTKGNSYAFTVGLASSNPAFRNPVISQDTILLLVYYASLTEGTGYGHIFHVFLHPNLDTCIDFSASCYSPDNSRTFTFCAYHGSVDYGGGRLVYTVEPYQDVPGCSVSGGPNAVSGDDLIDSTASTLSHEMFESITDPNGTGWFNFKTGDEIGDPCEGYLYSANLNGTNYAVQSEDSNLDHACIN